MNNNVWRPMTTGGRGQAIGDIYQLHAYVHPRDKYSPASWALYRHTEKIAHGYAPTIGDARRYAEAAIEYYGG